MPSKPHDDPQHVAEGWWQRLGIELGVLGRGKRWGLMHGHVLQWTINHLLVGGFNPFEKYYIVKLDHFPRVENKEYLKPPPSLGLGTCCFPSSGHVYNFRSLKRCQPRPSAAVSPNRIKANRIHGIDMLCIYYIYIYISKQIYHAWMSVEVSNESVSKLVYNLLKGLTTYLYRGYNPVTKYHGHPSKHQPSISLL